MNKSKYRCEIDLVVYKAYTAEDAVFWSGEDGDGFTWSGAVPAGVGMPVGSNLKVTITVEK